MFKSHWTGIAVTSPRSRYARARLQRSELRTPGVYVLIGPAEDVKVGSGRSRRECSRTSYGTYGETRTRTGDTTIFSRVLMRLKHAHMQGRRTRQERPHRTE